ncbi:hypothetical protein FH609_023705 [Streptomyces sp. 3MP-14]|uniref:Putative T7SS secretion signal domain-containing protein n=1 Tax=Streptomyces mimosae TaxID=2586635 RepID=A0A5N6ADQ4_9ACTN|nr:MULTISPECIES: hypothetical protein [Streptomyces]KAB8166365.1 hypothetical protein FH607_011065 [Streptomyces mimosae]KAB8174158.1 hypothetical protein FH609_023705 [Streptomyces sp. 3MP-14]
MSDGFPHLGFDPCPGDVSAAERVAETLRQITTASSLTHGTLLSINTDSGVWVGRAADAFSDAFSEVPPYLERAVNALDTASRALSTWVTQLDTLQARARALEEEAAGAAASVSAAQAGVDALPTDTSDLTDEERERHDQEAETERGRLDRANAALADIRERARTLNLEYTSHADDTARQLRNAADAAPPEPGLWDSVVGAFEGIGDFFVEVGRALSDPDSLKAIGDFFSNVATALGVVCLIVACFTPLGPLAWIALGASALAFGFHVAAKIGGADVGWDTIICDAIGVAGGALGIVGGRMIDAGRLTVAAGQGMRASGWGRFFSLGSLRHAVTPWNWSMLGGAGRFWGIAEYFRGVGLTMRGYHLIFTGRLISWGSSGAGNAAAATDLYRNWSVPFVGPIQDLIEARKRDNARAAAQDQPALPTVDATERLTAARGGFLNGLNQSDLGTAA